MRFLVDMNVSPKIAAVLRQEGHDAIHLSELGLGDADDVDVFARAAAESRIVVTFDLDFGEIVAASATRHTSVLLFRLRSMRFDKRPAPSGRGVARRHGRARSRGRRDRRRDAIAHPTAADRIVGSGRGTTDALTLTGKVQPAFCLFAFCS